MTSAAPPPIDAEPANDVLLPPPPPQAQTPPPPATPPGPTAADRAAEVMGRGAQSVWRTLAERRGLRVGLIGAALLAVGLYEGTGTALGLLLAIVGLVMVVVGAMGPRLRGRISLEFGPGGTSFDLQGHVAPPGRPLLTPAPETDIGRARMSLVPTADEVVEGTGETVEIDVAQLQRLLAEEQARSGA